MLMEIKYELKDIEFVVQKILPQIRKTPISLFEGEMGTGKTTFIQSLLKSMGITELNGSPTYSLINSYQVIDETIYHMDLFRLNSTQEGFDIGLEDILSENNCCLIEWPEYALPFVNSPYLHFQFKIIDDLTRLLICTKKSPKRL